MEDMRLGAKVTAELIEKSAPKYYMGAQQGLTNTILIALIGLGTISHSHKLSCTRNGGLMIQILGLLIFFVSVVVGLSSAWDFKYFLDNAGKALPELIDCDSWARLPTIIFAFITISLIMIIIVLSQCVFKESVEYERVRESYRNQQFIQRMDQKKLKGSEQEEFTTLRSEETTKPSDLTSSINSDEYQKLVHAP